MNKACCKMVSAAGIAILALSGGMTDQANAACNQANLTGTWYLFSGNSGAGGHHDAMHHGGHDGGHDASVRCKIVLSSTGAVVANGSSCVTRDDVDHATVAVAGGTVRVSPSCSVSGHLTYAGAGRHTIEFGKMDKTAHNIFSCTVYQTSNPDFTGVLTAVKQ